MSLINAMNDRFTLAQLNEQLVSMGYPEVGKADKLLACAAIATTLRGKQHAVATFWDLYQGNTTADDIQQLLDMAYPGCSVKSAHNQLCMFRNPEKYRPKFTPRYEVSGGRTGRVNSANVGNLSEDIATALRAFLGK
jgi:hypothetical protein